MQRMSDRLNVYPAICLLLAASLCGRQLTFAETVLTMLTEEAKKSNNKNSKKKYNRQHYCFCDHKHHVVVVVVSNVAFIAASPLSELVGRLKILNFSKMPQFFLFGRVIQKTFSGAHVQ